MVGKVTDTCGYYLEPPENAIVLGVDEKSRIQALRACQRLIDSGRVQAPGAAVVAGELWSAAHGFVTLEAGSR